MQVDIEQNTPRFVSVFELRRTVARLVTLIVDESPLPCMHKDVYGRLFDQDGIRMVEATSDQLRARFDFLSQWLAGIRKGKGIVDDMVYVSCVCESRDCYACNLVHGHLRKRLLNVACELIAILVNEVDVSLMGWQVDELLQQQDSTPMEQANVNQLLSRIQRLTRMIEERHNGY
jgi:hypothetical protein